MNFNLANIFQTNTGTADAGKVPAEGQTAPSSGQQGTEQIQNLPPGTVFSGEIIAVDGKAVQILLDGNTVINAKLEGAIEMAVGKLLSFEVKSAGNNQIELRPLYSNLDQNPAIYKAIDESNIPFTPKTVAMTSAMMEEGMSVNKKSMQNMFKQVSLNSMVDPKTIVQMIKLGLPITELTLSNFNQYKNYQHQILNSVENMAEEVPKLLNEMIASGDLKGSMQLNQQLLDLFLPKGGSLEGMLTSMAEGENSQAAAIVKDAVTTQMLKSDPAMSGAAKGEADIKAALNQPIIQDELDILKQTVSEDTNAASAKQTKSGEAPLGGAELTVLSEQEKQTLIMQLKGLGLPEGIGQQIQAGAISTENLMAIIKQLIDHGGDGKEESASQLLQGKEYQVLLKDFISKQWMLQPQDVDKSGKVEELYRKINEQTNKLLQLLNEAGKGDSNLSKGAEVLKGNVDFLNQLNQAMTYVQLPLKMNQENAHGDLYVYTKKKNLASKDGNVSALLHLDMEHLGTMDIYVAMQDEKVSTNFCLEKEEMLDFIEANLHILNDRLTKRGYNITSEVSVKEGNERTSMVDQFLGKNKGDASVQSLSFDVRA